MAKTKEQKRQEALDRLNKTIAKQREEGISPTRAQTAEHSALSYPKSKRVKSAGEKFSEKLFGPADPVTGCYFEYRKWYKSVAININMPRFCVCV